MSQRGRSAATDGPFIESKDVIGGLFIVEAKSCEGVVAAIADCPHLRGGNEIELRCIEQV